VEQDRYDQSLTGRSNGRPRTPEGVRVFHALRFTIVEKQRTNLCRALGQKNEFSAP